jgi:hypothetical protein
MYSTMKAGFLCTMSCIPLTHRSFIRLRQLRGNANYTRIRQLRGYAWLRQLLGYAYACQCPFVTLWCSVEKLSHHEPVYNPRKTTKTSFCPLAYQIPLIRGREVTNSKKLQEISSLYYFTPPTSERRISARTHIRLFPSPTATSKLLRIPTPDPWTKITNRRQSYMSIDL